MILSRRNLVGSLGALFAAPAIVRATSLMPIKPIEEVFAQITLDVDSGVPDTLPLPGFIKIERMVYEWKTDILADYSGVE